MTTLELCDTVAGTAYIGQLLFTPEAFMRDNFKDGGGGGGASMCRYAGVFLIGLRLNNILPGDLGYFDGTGKLHLLGRASSHLDLGDGRVLLPAEHEIALVSEMHGLVKHAVLTVVRWGASAGAADRSSDLTIWK